MVRYILTCRYALTSSTAGVRKTAARFMRRPPSQAGGGCRPTHCRGTDSCRSPNQVGGPARPRGAAHRRLLIQLMRHCCARDLAPRGVDGAVARQRRRRREGAAYKRQRLRVRHASAGDVHSLILARYCTSAADRGRCSGCPPAGAALRSVGRRSGGSTAAGGGGKAAAGGGGSSSGPGGFTPDRQGGTHAEHAAWLLRRRPESALLLARAEKASGGGDAVGGSDLLTGPTAGAGRSTQTVQRAR
jgi:hypothetical protein